MQTHCDTTMGCPEVEMSEKARQVIAKVSGILNMICVLPSLIILSVGSYIQVAIQENIGLIEGFNGDILPAFMIIFGGIGAFVGLFSGKVCWTNRNSSKRPDWSKYLFPLVIVELILAIFVFVSAIMCFAQIAMLESSFKQGISSAMRTYKSDPMKKNELDNLQIEFQCCGSTSYTDWFHVSWIHDEYLTEAKKKLLKSRAYINDDVPFSCCSPNILRPCIHHHVHDNDMHYNYDYRTRVTLHGIGCLDALMEFYGDRLLTDVGALVLAISFIQMITVTLMRLLQTSVDESLESDDAEEPTTGYIFPCSGKKVIKAVKKEVKKFHKNDKAGDFQTTEPLLEDQEDSCSLDTDDISNDTDSFDDEPFYEECQFEQTVPYAEPSNLYMTINSAEMLPQAPPPPAPPPPAPPLDRIPPPPSNLTTGNNFGQYTSGHIGMVSNHMIATDQYPTGQRVVSGNHAMDSYPNGQLEMLYDTTHANQYPNEQIEYGMPGNQVMGSDGYGTPNGHVSPRRTHLYVNELPQQMHPGQHN